MHWKPRKRASIRERSEWRLERASATTLELPFLYFKTKENDWRNSTHFACLGLSLCCPLRYGLVIRMENKLPWPEIMWPVFKGPDYSIKLQLISAVILPWTIQLLTKISKRALALDENSTYAHSTSKTWSKSGRARIGASLWPWALQKHFGQPWTIQMSRTPW